MKNEMTRNASAKDAVIHVVTGLIGAAALACIIISMVTNKLTPYLVMGLGLGSIGNAIGTVTILRKKGRKDGSYKDGNIS